MAERAVQDYESPHRVPVHKLTNDPDRAYRAMKWDNLKTLNIENPSTPVAANKVRIVCISDTHCKTKDLVLPDGDILLHSGDFTTRGYIDEVQLFADFMEKQTHKHKVVIAGNHELSFGYCDGYCDPRAMERLCGRNAVAKMTGKLKELNISHPKELLKGCIYLDNSAVSVCGLKIWGSPWTTKFHNWAYNAKRGAEMLSVWDKIPSDTDILMTHGPPLGIGDRTILNERAGCVELLTTVTERVKPQIHLFGHVHEGYGMFSDGVTTFVNGSTCSARYQASHAPVVIDVDLPEGFSKDDVTVLPVEDSSPILYSGLNDDYEGYSASLIGQVFAVTGRVFRAVKNTFW